MKVLGYIDDAMTQWFQWQLSLPLKFQIPLCIMELMLAGFIIFRLRR